MEVASKEWCRIPSGNNNTPDFYFTCVSRNLRVYVDKTKHPVAQFSKSRLLPWARQEQKTEVRNKNGECCKGI